MTDRILIIDDDASACQFLADALTVEGFSTFWTADPEQGLTLAEQPETAAVVTDVNMPKLQGIELCRRIVEKDPLLPVIVVTAFGSIDSAVAAMKAGAYDFVTKPFDVETVTLSLRRALDHYALRRELRDLRAAFDLHRYGQLLGKSEAMLEIYDLIERLASSEASVLITGESGTGKELVARELHRRSPRARGPFIAINCAALPEALLESELFGHTRGAFTDAKVAKDGLFSKANGGTIFLDEIGDMPLGLQPKLLRALQEGTIRPVGGAAEVPFDARIITATNRDLEEAIAGKQFREDLYYRLNVVQIDLPPLRRRGADVLLLARALLAQLAVKAGKNVADISASASEKLLAYEWPGNVRELRNCIERAVALCRSDAIDVADLPPKIRDYEARSVLVAANDSSDLVPLEEVERRYILRVLEICHGNKSVAAKVLGLNRKTLHRRLEGFGAAAAAAGSAREPESDEEPDTPVTIEGMAPFRC
ncbi:MAG TPA: sigma-54 dependent transcriptional regulator [Polyangiaceae bacterium]|nr:sigma-54 dependent transcriptional regulator [Polyangiaceae bacterium]